MGEKKKRKSARPQTRSKQNRQIAKKRSKLPQLALAVGVALIIIGVYYLKQERDSNNPSSGIAKIEKENVRTQRAGSAPLQVPKVKKKNTRLRETRPTLSPQRFRGKVRSAYEMAREIPEVLDNLYCYCRCRENFGHKSLLSCYVDNHASTWKICMDEAQLAFQMNRQGATVTEIQNEIDRRFGK